MWDVKIGGWLEMGNSCFLMQDARELRAWADVRVREEMEGHGCVGEARLCLLLSCTPYSHVATVISSHKGLEEGQKLHNHALKPVGAMPLLPSMSLFSL